jgi:hypothetical protein
LLLINYLQILELEYNKTMRNKNMKLVVLGFLIVAFSICTSKAANYLTVDFSTGYTVGSLAGLTANAVGQNGWAQTSASATTPIQYSSTLGGTVVNTSGQDIWKALTSAAPNTAGTSLLSRVDFKITAAQAGGDYFFNVSDPAGTISNFYQRLFARSTTGGFNLGIMTTSGAGSATMYGTSVFNFNQTYTAVLGWDFVTGALNDTMNLYVNPTSNIRANLTAEVTSNWLSTGVAEPTATISAVNLRQGSSTAAPSAVIFSLSVGDSLASVGVPEPSSSMLMVAGAAALIGLRAMRRKNS